MKPEQKLFEEIRTELVDSYPQVEFGNMMGSPAITQNGKVFAFLSKKFLMVFKLGKGFDPSSQNFEVRPFNPFKKKGPLAGWFEVPYSSHQYWKPLTQEALELNT